jgi:hypothetical protein
MSNARWTIYIESILMQFVQLLCNQCAICAIIVQLHEADSMNLLL